MGIETALIGSAAISAGSGILGGMAKNKEAKRQARITRQQSAEDAAEEIYQGEHFRADQTLSFLKSGVTLAGSPLLVLQETERRSKANADRIMRSGNEAAKAFEKQGRNALFDGIGGALTTGLKTYSMLQ